MIATGIRGGKFFLPTKAMPASMGTLVAGKPNEMPDHGYGAVPAVAMIIIIIIK